MLLIGHRGCSYPGYNQNTLRAFAKVADEGVAAIEFDVQLTKDGQLVVVHNLDLAEVSTGEGKVCETDSAAIRSLYAGNLERGRDRIPFLAEVFTFFASLPADRRPSMHVELKGCGTGEPAAELASSFVASGRLAFSDFLVSSFNWQELRAFVRRCPKVKIALLDGAIRRRALCEKAGIEAENCFADLFAYGNEEYMLPRFPTVAENIDLLRQQGLPMATSALVEEEIGHCLTGDYYGDELLDAACEMKAASLNLWYRSVSAKFIEKAHRRGLAVLVYTVNIPEELLLAAEMGVDGIFTDYYTDAVRTLTTRA